MFDGVKRAYDVSSTKYELEDWDEKCLELNRKLVEETIDEAHIRENAIYSRVGSLLALNGVILAIMFTFLGAKIESNSTPAYFIIAGICSLIISILILGYMLIPATRRVVNLNSCVEDPGYTNNKKNPLELMKAITNDRINNYNDLQNLINVSAVQLMLAILFSVAGLIMMGFSLIFSTIAEEYAICICLALVTIMGWFMIQYIKQANV